MSDIMTALRELELEQQERSTHSMVHLVASGPTANDFSVLKEFTAPQALQFENHQQQAIAHQPQLGREALILFADDDSALEQGVVRAVETVKRERQGRLAAEERAVHAEAEMTRQALRIDELEREVHALESENDHRRQRVRQMMDLLDSIEPSGGE